jgi:general stress protein YciG
MASSNPSNFANLPKDELREIAAKGGHASHGGTVNIQPSSMTKSTLTSHQTTTTATDSNDHAGRNPDGTFTKGSEVAKELGAQGGHASHGGNTHADRNPDGTFTKGSELAKELGAQGGHAAHEAQTTAGDDGVS